MRVRKGGRGGREGGKGGMGREKGIRDVERGGEG